jgi:hypothetical protein
MVGSRQRAAEFFAHPGAAAPHLGWSRNRLVTRSSDLLATAALCFTRQMIMQRLRGDAEAPWPAEPAEIIDRYPRESRWLYRASDPAGETADAFKRAGRNRRDLRFAKPLPPADRNLAQPLIELHLHGALAKAFADEFGRAPRAWLGTGGDRCPQSVRQQAQPPADCPRLRDTALGQR